MKYHFKIHTERSGGYWADCIELAGCRTQAGTMAKLEANMSEALNLYLSEPSDSRHIFPAPQRPLSGKAVVAVPVRPSVAIANRIRELRIKMRLTQMSMKNRLGIKTLSNYQRLEDPARANPQWTTLVLIKKTFPAFRIEDLLD